MEALVVCEPVHVGDYGVGIVEVGKQIQYDGSAIPLVRPVLDPYKVFLYDHQKLFPEGAVHILKGVEGECCCVVSISDGHCFGSCGALQDYRRRFRIGRGHDPCFQEGCIDSAGEGEAQVPERAVAEVCVDRSRVLVEGIDHDVDHGVRQFAANQWYHGFFNALDKFINGGGYHGGGGGTN